MMDARLPISSNRQEWVRQQQSSVSDSACCIPLLPSQVAFQCPGCRPAGLADFAAWPKTDYLDYLASLRVTWMMDAECSNAVGLAARVTYVDHGPCRPCNSMQQCNTHHAGAKAFPVAAECTTAHPTCQCAKCATDQSITR